MTTALRRRLRYRFVPAAPGAAVHIANDRAPGRVEKAARLLPH